MTETPALLASGLLALAKQRRDGVVYADCLDVSADTANQARQYVSGPDLYEGINAIGHHFAYRANPFDRRDHLRRQLRADVVGAGAHLTGDVGDDGHLRIAQWRAIDDFGQSCSRLLHERRM